MSKTLAGRRFVTALLLAVTLTPAPAIAHAGCRSSSCVERVARKQCSQRHPRACTRRAILTYRLTGWQAAWMRRIPGCESHWDALAYFPGQIAETWAERRFAIRADRSAGLYAFKPSTWRGTRYRRWPIFEAKWNALAAAWMLRAGRSGEWACR